MLDVLRSHPFGVEAFFRRSLVLTYAMPADFLRAQIGPGLTLDTYDGDWGFLAIALVQTEALRPKGFPRWLGRDFFLSGYRIFTRFVRPGQPTLRGLRILRSDTDRPSMVALGNVFTHYNYALADVTTRATDARFEVQVRTAGAVADLHVDADLSVRTAVTLPEQSPFRSMQDARTFAGPLPFTFGYDASRRQMLVVKGVRQTWEPRPVQVVVHHATFLDQLPFAGVERRLANAFFLERIPYAWKPGRLEPLS